MTLHSETTQSQRPKSSFGPSHVTEKDSLKRHIKQVHEENPLKCDICISSYAQKGHLKHHTEKFMKEKRLPCILAYCLLAYFLLAYSYLAQSPFGILSFGIVPFFPDFWHYPKKNGAWKVKLFGIFQNLKPKEVAKTYKNIICTYLKEVYFY